jgi:uncharacterized protein
VQLLISPGADVNAVNDDAQTPLHIAVKCGAALSVRLLPDAGASVNAAAVDDEQPLHYAAINHEHELCTLLLERGADLHALSTGESVLRYAVRACEYAESKWCESALQCVQLLVAAGADVQEYSAEWGTLLHSSATSNCAAVTQYLLEQLLPAQPDVVNKLAADGTTALYCAAACNNAAVVKLLLASGASIHADSAPLLHACFRGAVNMGSSADVDTFDLLLQAGASVMQLDHLG